MRAKVCLTRLVIVTLSFSQMVNLALAEPSDQLKRRINLIKVAATEDAGSAVELRAKQEQLVSFQSRVDRIVNFAYNACTSENAMFIKDSGALDAKARMKFNISGMLFTLLVDKSYKEKDSSKCAKIPDLKLNELWARKVSEFGPAFNQANEGLLTATKVAAKKECSTELKATCGAQASPTCTLDIINRSIGEELQRCFDIPEDDLKYAGFPVVLPSTNTQGNSLTSKTPNEGCTLKSQNQQPIEGLNRDVTAICAPLIDKKKGERGDFFSKITEAQQNLRKKRLEEESRKSPLQKLQDREDAALRKVEFNQKQLNLFKAMPKRQEAMINSLEEDLEQSQKELKEIQRLKQSPLLDSSKPKVEPKAETKTAVEELREASEEIQRSKSDRKSGKEVKKEGSPEQKLQAKVKYFKKEVNFYENMPKRDEAVINKYKARLEKSQRELEAIQGKSKTEAKKESPRQREPKVDFLSKLSEAQQVRRKERQEAESRKSPQQKLQDQEKAAYRKVEFWLNQVKSEKASPEPSKARLDSHYEELKKSIEELKRIRSLLKEGPQPDSPHK